MKKEYIVENLHCAGCAAKIQNELEKLDKVKNLNLNFYNKKLTFELENPDLEDDIFKKMNEIADRLEPGTILKREKVKMDEKKEKINLKLWIAVVLFVVSILTKNKYIYILVYLLTGYEVIFTALKNLKKGNFLDENFLMSIATLGALILGEYSEAAGVMLFYNIGEYFQEKAVGNSRKSIESLMKIKPEIANLKTDLGLKIVKPEEVRVGDIVVVKPGEKIPLDSIVKKGKTTIDKSALTGESLPEEIKENDEVLSGSINLTNTIELKVIRNFDGSTVSRIIEMVESASNKKAKAEKFITKFAKYYTPIVVLLAVVIVLIPLIFGLDFKVWLNKALIFLVISCPCALVLSIPLTFFASIGRASKKGILIKGGNYLEKLNEVNTIIFDKTGTLTEGKFKVVDVEVFNGDRDDLLKYAKIAEYYSNHPIGKAISEYIDLEIEEDKILGAGEKAGFGVNTIYDGKEILAGNLKYMLDSNISVESQIKDENTVVYIAVDGICLGKITVADEVKKNSEKTIKELLDMGIESYILTGDNIKIAKKIAKKLGVKKENIFAHLLPENKVEKVEEIKNKYKNIAFIGDGINDAPVLSMADVGIAMGKNGSDIAIESSDIVFMKDDPYSVVELLKIAKMNKRVVYENIVLALGIKIVVMILGILGVANMWIAIFADVGVSILAVLNASKILRKK